MKVNVISDIHATVVDGKAIYNKPLDHSIKKYSKIFDVFYTYFTENIDIIKNCHNNISSFNWLTTFDEIEQLVNKLKMSHDCQYTTIYLSENDIYIFFEFCNYLKMNLVDCFYKKRLIKTPAIAYQQFLLKQLYDFKPEKLESADYLIIAGDIGTDDNYLQILDDIKNRVKDKFKDVLVVKGNHDYWKKTSKFTSDQSINLNNDKFEYVVDDYVFIGCTMWTHVPERYKYTVSYYMNDYRYIPNFSVDKSNELFNEYKNWIETAVECYKNKKVIIITHHCPFKEMIPVRYDDGRNVAINFAYTVKDDIFVDINKYNNIVLWCCGHTHVNFNNIINNIHCVRNPIGYGDLYGFRAPENDCTHWYNNVIEI